MLSAESQEFSRQGAERYARGWADAARRAGAVPMAPAELERLLLEQTLRLAHAVLAQPFTGQPGTEAGRALVEAELTGPEIVAWSVRALGERFLPAVLPAQLGSVTARERITQLQGALAAGHARALREREPGGRASGGRASGERGSGERGPADRPNGDGPAEQARDDAEQALRDSEARFRAVFTGAAIGIGIADLAGRLIEVNQAFADMLGYSMTELRRINVAALFHPDDATDLRELYRDLLTGRRDRARVEKRYYRKDGSALWTDLSVSLIRHDDGRPRFTVAMIEDITARYELQERLRFQALHDPLTGLPNRTLFFERLAEALDGAAEGDRLGVCFLDLDGFKAVNDRLGHAMGDRLLGVIAERLADGVASRGHLVARMGGDEFVILVPHTRGTQDVVAVAEAALDTVAAPVRIDEHQLEVSASIGVVEGPAGGTNPTDLMKAADTTLYWAKAEGRGRFALFDPVRSADHLARSMLAAELPAALERGEFLLDYQPIVTLADGTLYAVEALVRWRHPDLGLLGPDRFIGLAEKSGLIVRLGRWVLEHACEQASRWHADFPEARLVVNVNLAAQQVSDPGIVAEVADVLARTGLPAELLQLELTESAVMATTGEPLRSLRRLAALGVRLAIDDFGTGYSNLAYLRRMPIHTLKLAAPFVEGIRAAGAETTVDEQIVDALVRLAHALGLAVTAEAVETPEQVERLRALGCDTGQGRFYGDPGGADDISARLSFA
ncbi:EAL domain-containing protein [Micromonospora sp. NPDC049679]|uniref:putative bifunctional diguanylate cyclase/phosphodiesterase n=1 Tax=Micromonospora sp. NPDC049679 TaxID=3155920 RepID=UPI0033DB9E4E